MPKYFVEHNVFQLETANIDENEFWKQKHFSTGACRDRGGSLIQPLIPAYPHPTFGPKHTQRWLKFYKNNLLLKLFQSNLRRRIKRARYMTVTPQIIKNIIDSLFYTLVYSHHNTFHVKFSIANWIIEISRLCSSKWTIFHIYVLVF